MVKLKDWFEDDFSLPHAYGESVLIKPNTTLFVPARINLKAIIESERRIKTNEYVYFREDREVPSLFWDENLISSNGNVYVFETKYYTESDEILPTSYLNQIPEKLSKKFLRKVPSKVSKLADKLTGNETDTRKILRKFCEFVYEHEKSEDTTTGKSVKKLLKEYEKEGCFYGNCKEARNFYVALCNSKGFPTKKVLGKSLKPCGHVWVDVFVSTNNGYKLFPVDPALGYFGNFNTAKHLFLEHVPSSIHERLDFITRKGYKLRLRIERAE